MIPSLDHNSKITLNYLSKDFSKVKTDLIQALERQNLMVKRENVMERSKKKSRKKRESLEETKNQERHMSVREK